MTIYRKRRQALGRLGVFVDVFPHQRPPCSYLITKHTNRPTRPREPSVGMNSEMSTSFPLYRSFEDSVRCHSMTASSQYVSCMSTLEALSVSLSTMRLIVVNFH